MGSSNQRGRSRWTRVGVAGVTAALVLGGTGCAQAAPARTQPRPARAAAAAPTQAYTLEQTLSDNAQLMTIAFDGLGFLTGSLGSDSFFPPGKVADFWGFQYLRDNDPSGMGHNTDFLTRASLNMLDTLDASQRRQLIALAGSQVSSINKYGYRRFVLMKAFRRLLSGSTPARRTGLDGSAVEKFSGQLYRLDGDISLQRAQVMGAILDGLSDQQRARLDAMVGTGMTSWPVVAEPEDLRPLSRDEKVAVMTYAGDMFSWYAGTVEADVYFCPERQGTYFGSFYLKDAPAVGNPGYSIGTNITGDMGRAFLETLTTAQRRKITALVAAQKPALLNIVTVRRRVATELRQSMTGGTPSPAKVDALMTRYGKLDGEIVTRYATAFSAVGKSLTAAQRSKLDGLRTQLLGDLSPSGAFLYSEPIPMPDIPDTDFLFDTARARKARR